jgi:opacity protein-like surface antigen
MRLGQLTCAALAAAIFSLPAPARAQQAINLSLGGFVVTGEDARVDDDVLFANREILSFDIADFNTGSAGIEWLLPVGEFFEIGAGAGITSRRVPTVYSDFVDRDGSEIEQDLRLRIVPLTATVRVLPFGRSRAVQPYIGGGIGFFNYRYSEVGDFVDFTDRSVFTDRFVAEGTETGPVVLAGLRFPVGDVWSLGGEVRYQKAEADLSTDFLGSKLDLSGVHYLFTVHVKF